MFASPPKIVFTGPMGAGKTAAIRAISEIEPISTDVANTTREVCDKALTTVGFDYGEITLGDGSKVQLFGTPGQERFDFIWQILGDRAVGVIVLIDHQRQAPLRDLALFLNAFGDVIDRTGAVVAITHFETAPPAEVEAYFDYLAADWPGVPALAVDARVPEEVTALVALLLNVVESRAAEVQIA